ncbi:MAG: hypothetical protein IMX00_07285 [Limnochordales bacterium]|nr:hypothetical protein [Limnochordales bacterium]
MGFADWARGLFRQGRQGNAAPAAAIPVTQDGADAIKVFVRCRRCGEPISVRIRLTDEVGEAEEGAACAYWVQKEISGSGRRRCFQRMHLRLEMDRDRQVVRYELTGADLLTPEEYRRELARWESPTQ